jgi:hypothetical protein
LSRRLKQHCAAASACCLRRGCVCWQLMWRGRDPCSPGHMSSCSSGSSRPATEVVQETRHCRLVAVRSGQLPGSTRKGGFASLMRGTSQTATAAGSQQWACAAARGARRRNTAGAAAFSAAACAAMPDSTCCNSGTAGWVLGPAYLNFTQCRPTPCFAPAAAGSARWRTGLPTSASAAPPEAWAAQLFDALFFAGG